MYCNWFWCRNGGGGGCGSCVGGRAMTMQNLVRIARYNFNVLACLKIVHEVFQCKLVLFFSHMRCFFISKVTLTFHNTRILNCICFSVFLYGFILFPVYAPSFLFHGWINLLFLFFLLVYVLFFEEKKN